MMLKAVSRPCHRTTHGVVECCCSCCCYKAKDGLDIYNPSDNTTIVLMCQYQEYHQ